MKFLVETAALQKKMQAIGGVIGTNNILPILENFLFEIQEGILKISATDLHTFMSTTLPVEATQEGRIAVPARIIQDTLKVLPNQPLTISIDMDTYAIEITSETGKYKLIGESAAEYPTLPHREEVVELDIPSKVLHTAISSTFFATSNNELQTAMRGIYFELATDKISFVATDAHKLVCYTRKDISPQKDTSFIVPRKSMSILKGILPMHQDASVHLAFDTTNVFFDFDDICLVCRLVDAKYPNYRAVVPTENPFKLSINRLDLLNALKRIAIYSSKTTHRVVFSIKGGHLQLSAQDIDFSNEASEQLLCTYQGEDLSIGFNSKFLIEMLAVLHSEMVEIELSSPVRAGLLLPTEVEQGEELLMLLMPITVKK